MNQDGTQVTDPETCTPTQVGKGDDPTGPNTTTHQLHPGPYELDVREMVPTHSQKGLLGLRHVPCDRTGTDPGTRDERGLGKGRGHRRDERV